MQVLSTVQLPLLQTLSVGNLFCYLDANNISAEGMLLMPESKMGQLRLLILGTFLIYSDKNNIGSVGAKLLTKAELPLLQTLWLSNYLQYLRLLRVGRHRSQRIGQRALAKSLRSPIK